MGDTWMALGDISSARTRLSILPGLSASQPYERLDPSEDSERIQHQAEPRRSDSPSLLSARTEPQPSAKTHSKVYWFRKQFWVQEWQNLRQFPWRKVGRRCLPGVLPPLAFLGTLALLILMGTYPDLFLRTDERGCTPDGEFRVLMRSDLYTPWTRSSFFAVNMKYGRYDFATAKMIDVAWDVGVGRGGQAVLGVISYKIFTGLICHMMGNSSVNYPAFKAVTLQNDSISGLGNLTKGIWLARNHWLRYIILWMIVAGAFVLLTPTWLSAMTGYTADVTPMTAVDGGARVPTTNFKPVVYTIHDGAHLERGFTNETMIAVPWAHSKRSYRPPFYLDAYGVNGCEYDYTVRSPGNETDERIVWRNSTDLDCKRLFSVSKYVDQYGLLGKNPSTNSTFQMPDDTNITTEVHLSFVLNISAYFPATQEQIEQDEEEYGRDPGSYSLWYFRPAGRLWKDPDTSERPFNIPSPRFWDPGSGTTYKLTDFLLNTRCQPEGLIQYRWGFSFLLLLAYMLTLLFWSIGMWALYLHQKLHAQPELAKRELGIERAVLDIAQSMGTKLDPAKAHLQGSSELEVLTKNLHLTYSDLCGLLEATPAKETFSLRKWLRKEIWWLIVLCIFIILFSLSLVGVSGSVNYLSYLTGAWSPWFSCMPLLSILLVLAAGRDVPGRWVLAVPFLLLFVGLDIWWIFETLVSY